MAFITQPKTSLSIKEIILESVKRIGELSTQEFRGGFTQRQFQGNSWNDVYIPDTRKQVIQSIDFIRMLVAPKFDKEMKEDCAEIMKEQEENYNQNAEKDVETYTITKLKLMLRLFEKMNVFFERKKYFKAQGYEEQSGEEDFKDE